MSRFWFQIKFCNLSLVLGDRLHLEHFLKSGDITLATNYSITVFSTRFELLHRSSLNLVKITVMLYCVARIMSPDFLKKCQMQPISQDQWQIAKFVLEFKSTHPTSIIFDGIRIGWIFSLLKDLFHNVKRIIWRTIYYS